MDEYTKIRYGMISGSYLLKKVCIDIKSSKHTIVNGVGM